MVPTPLYGAGAPPFIETLVLLAAQESLGEGLPQAYESRVPAAPTVDACKMHS
jgi:hypothetical protein